MIIDGGLKNKDTVAELAKKYGIKKVVVSTYHPQANKMMEHSHEPIINAPLSKMSAGRFTNGVQNLPTVLWADRLTIHISTDLTPYYISCGTKLILPIKLEVSTLRILP